MYQTKPVGIVIVFVTSIVVGCYCGGVSYDDPEIIDYDDDASRVDHLQPLNNHAEPSWSCDTETQTALTEIRSEIRNLQRILVGLRLKLDPDFKLEPPVEVESKCPAGFDYLEKARSCYKVVRESVNWISADQRCRDLQPEAHLVAITTEDENIGLSAYLRKISRRFRGWSQPRLWTSGQRLDETSCASEFVWKISNSTQLPLSFTHWDTEEPNCWRNEVEGCLEITSNAGLNWNDTPCYMVMYPLCEFDPL